VVVAIVAVAALVVTLLLAPPPPPAAAEVTDDTPSFTLNQNDLEFILRQIQISEAHAADVLNPSNYELLCTDQGDAAQNCVSDEARPKGLRTVDGSFNNLRVQRVDYGASDVAFPRLLEAEWRQAEPEELELGFEANEPAQVAMCDEGTTCYAQTQGNVYDSHPREISNLIVDQTTNNPAIVNQLEAGTAIPVPGTNRVAIPNTAPDEELSAPFNTFLGFFGQFFDHGLDLVSKGGNGTMIVPLAADDPLYCPPGGQKENASGVLEPCNPDGNYITLSRATRVDGDSTEHLNLTTPFIDQNQTYSSHPSMQVFLREYTIVNGAPRATGRLIEGETEGMAKWRDVKRQAREVLGIELTDADLLDVPLLLTDLYGNFVPGDNGFPQMLTGDPANPTRVEGSLAGNGADVPADALGTGHAFLDDIAHGSTPVMLNGELLPRFDEDGTPVLDQNGQPVLTGYDNALLDEHFIAGDGRVNENVGLTAVHAVFHAEHNRMIGVIEQLLNGTHPDQALLEAQDSDARGGIAEFAKAFRGEAHSYISHKPEETLPQPQADDWNYEERLFQAAKFATEMQYQHLVFEEFARKIAPTIDGVVFNENSYDANRNPSVSAEFAHVVYRFGHSMMTETIGREPVVDGDQTLRDIPLLDGFLNPRLFDEGGTLSTAEAAGAWVNGMTARVGSQIDEHVVDVLRNNLLGLPLDLPTLNLLRGRDAGVPPLQEARRQFWLESGDEALRPFANWSEFGRGTKNGNNFGRGGENASLVNFVAAYGKHESLLEAGTLEEKRNAAALLVNGAPLGEEFVIRLAGANRFETAEQIARRHFAAPVPVAYVAPGGNFPDALAGGPLAAQTGGPILLTFNGDTGELPLSTVLALKDLAPERIVVLGGPGVVGPNTVAALNAISTTDQPVERIWGANRFETAAQISKQLEPNQRVFIANGMNFPDALAGAAVAAADGSAVLLVTPTAIPDATKSALMDLSPSEIVILGETGAVSASVAAQLRAYTTGDVVRLGGANRYETATAIAQHFFPSGAGKLYLATGTNFPDALTSTPGAGIADAPLLLVPPAGLTPELRAEIERINPQQIIILGGTGVVSAAVEEGLAEFAPEPLSAPDDRLDFMNSTGAYGNVGGQTVTGLEDVDFWVGGLAERINTFGGMLGATFTYVFENQLEDLQFGDRFYYLFRNEGEQLFAALEGNTFSDMIQRNTMASHLPADVFALQNPVLDITEQAALPEGEREAGLVQLSDGTWSWNGDEHVEMHGTPGDDRLRGDEGDDAIWGYAGNDRIEGGAGADSLVGGPGDDIITDSHGDDNIKGMQGNDFIHSGPGLDLVIGGLGDDFMVNGPDEGNVFFAGMGNDIVLGTTGRFQAVIGGEHDDWIEGGPHADLLQGDNADQFQNDVLGGHDVVAGRLGNDDVEGEGGDDILIGHLGGTDRNHGGLGWDWLTYYGQNEGVTSDWAFNRFFEPNNPLPSRFDLLEALSGGAGDDVLRGPLTEADDLSPSDIEVSKATMASLERIDGLVDMLQPVVEVGGVEHALGDFSLPFLRGAPQSDSDGVHMIIIGGPGSDVVEGRLGNDYLDGDAMLRVQLEAAGVRYDSALQLMPLVRSGEINPGDIDIVREIVYDDDPNAIDTAEYNNPFAAYTITPLGPLGSGYWRVEHTQVQEAEESDGIDIIRGFERLQFTDGCAQLAEDGMSWESCLPTAQVTMTPTTPTEGEAVTAELWAPGEVGTTPFDTSEVTNLRYTWWSGEGDSPDNIGEWEELLNPLGSASATYVPTQEAVGQYLMVTASYTDSDGFFRAASSAVSEQPVADVPHPGSLAPLSHAIPLVPAAPIAAGVPTDPDGGIQEDSTLAYQWSWSDAAVAPDVDDDAAWNDYPDGAVVEPGSSYAPTPDDIGRWIRVTITYTDGGGTTESVSARTTLMVTAN
jgi:putative cell wall-binding protein/Ca2+-binding RTX toxin-like protein